MRMIKFFVAAVLATGCMPMSGGGAYGGSTYGGGYTAQAVTTGVYVNGTEIDATMKAKLDWLLDYTVPPGRYFVTEQGLMGIEGQHATINLVAYANAKGIDLHGNTTVDQPGRSDPYDRGTGNVTSYGKCVSMSSGSMTFLGSGC